MTIRSLIRASAGLILALWIATPALAFDCTASGEFFWGPVGTTSGAGSTRVASPIRPASSPEIFRPVSSRSAARSMPTSRGSVQWA